jgi:hypothetical protein
VTEPEIRYAHPQIGIPMDLWDSLCLYADVTQQNAGAVVSRLVADFLINDWEELVIEAARNRAAEARCVARDYLERTR